MRLFGQQRRGNQELQCDMRPKKGSYGGHVDNSIMEVCMHMNAHQSNPRSYPDMNSWKQAEK